MVKRDHSVESGFTSSSGVLSHLCREAGLDQVDEEYPTHGHALTYQRNKISSNLKRNSI
jgi:hypothetical protein